MKDLKGGREWRDIRGILVPDLYGRDGARKEGHRFVSFEFIGDNLSWHYGFAVYRRVPSPLRFSTYYAFYNFWNPDSDFWAVAFTLPASQIFRGSI